MNDEQKRYFHHAREDSHLSFWLNNEGVWERFAASDISKEVLDGRSGLVAYPSGEVLCQLGEVGSLPEGVHFMTGPNYTDDGANFSRRLVRAGRGAVRITHGKSASQLGATQWYYSTTLRNDKPCPIRVTKFGPLLRGFLGIRRNPEDGYYSPLQFREWFRVPDPEGWIETGEVVCDPDNYGSGNGVWAYFLETKQGDRFISTVPLENKSVQVEQAAAHKYDPRAG